MFIFSLLPFHSMTLALRTYTFLWSSGNLSVNKSSTSTYPGSVISKLFYDVHCEENRFVECFLIQIKAASKRLLTTISERAISSHVTSGSRCRFVGAEQWAGVYNLRLLGEFTYHNVALSMSRFVTSFIFYKMSVC